MKFTNYTPSWRFGNITSKDVVENTKTLNYATRKKDKTRLNHKILLRISKNNEITKQEYQNLDDQAKMFQRSWRYI